MEEQALEFLLRYSDWIKDAGFFSSIWHTFVMWLIKISYQVAVFTENVIDQVFKVTGFLDEGIIGTVYISMRILSASVLAVTIIYIVYKYMFSDQVDLKGSLFRGVLFLNLIIYLPGLMNSAMDVTKATFDATKDLQGTDSSLSYNIVQSNMADLTYLSRNGFELLESSNLDTPTMNLSETAFKNADLTEMILPSDISDLKKTASNEENTEALGYTIEVADDGSLYADKIQNGWFSTFDNGKFRFKADTATILIALWTMTFVYLCSGFTIGSAILELVFARILFPVLAAMDIETGQKVKRIFEDMGNTFVTIMLTGFSISLFSIYFTYLATLNLNIVAYAILCLVGVSMSMSGPRTFGKYLGVDTSARNGLKSIIGGYYGAKAAMGLGKSAVGLGAAAVHAPENIREAGSKVVNGVSNKLDNDKKVLSGIGKGAQDGFNKAKDGVENKLDTELDDIFDKKPTISDDSNPISNEEYEKMDQKNEEQNPSQAEEQKDSDKNNDEKDANGDSVEIGTNGAVDTDQGTDSDIDKVSVEDSGEEKSVSDSELNTEGHDLSDDEENQLSETDEDGKVIIQDSSKDQEDKSVNDASEIKEQSLKQGTEQASKEDPSINGRSGSTEGTAESKDQEQIDSGVDNPDKKNVEQLPEENSNQNLTQDDSQPAAQNEEKDDQKQVVHSEQKGELSKREDQTELSSSETTSKPTETIKTSHSPKVQKDKGTKHPEGVTATNKTIYKESEAKPIWEEKKQSDILYANTNDQLKTMDVEEFLPPKQNEREELDGE